jgi:hypothetical protein
LDSTDASEVLFLIGITRRRWVGGLFIAFGVFDLVDGLVLLLERPSGPIERSVNEMILGLWFFLVAFAWFRTNLVAGKRGITIRNPLGRAHFYPWAGISQFAYQGRIFPTAAVVLHTGRVIRIAALNQGVCVREEEPSWDMRAAVAELDKRRSDDAIGASRPQQTTTP